MLKTGISKSKQFFVENPRKTTKNEYKQDDSINENDPKLSTTKIPLRLLKAQNYNLIKMKKHIDEKNYVDKKSKSPTRYSNNLK